MQDQVFSSCGGTLLQAAERTNKRFTDCKTPHFVHSYLSRVILLQVLYATVITA